MASTEQSGATQTQGPIGESVQAVVEPALEAVHRFVDAVNDAFPDIRDDGPRRKIIDAAFKMVDDLVGASFRFADQIVQVGQSAAAGTEDSTESVEVKNSTEAKDAPS
jgi:hypothetical protein